MYSIWSPVGDQFPPTKTDYGLRLEIWIEGNFTNTNQGKKVLDAWIGL